MNLSPEIHFQVFEGNVLLFFLLGCFSLNNFNFEAIGLLETNSLFKSIMGFRGMYIERLRDQERNGERGRDMKRKKRERVKREREKR